MNPDLTPKRRARDGGVDAWYPYYAGFSSRFAESALAELKLGRTSVVLDPWAGSGTTLTAALKLGLRSKGVDVNPFAAVLAAAKLVQESDARSVEQVLARVVQQAARHRMLAVKNDPACEWLGPGAAGEVRALLAATMAARGVTSVGELPRDPTAAFLTLALIKAARKIAAPESSANPTWGRAGARKRANRATVRQAFLEAAIDLLDRVEGDASCPAEIRLGDARSLPFRTQTIDAVLTSPPYLTRIDYPVTTRFELAMLGVGGRGELTALRRRTMGATVLRPDEETAVDPTWPRQLKTLLARVRKHPSHRSEEYYFRNLLQYFRDAEAALAEIRRVLKPGGVATFVLQTSYYKEIEIDLPTLFLALGRRLEMSGQKKAEIAVGRVMTSLNKRARRYGERSYRECVIELRG